MISAKCFKIKLNSKQKRHSIIWTTFLFLISIVNLQITHASEITLAEGASFIPINGIKHWVKVKGIEHETTPIVVVHGGPGGNNYNFERTMGPLLEKFATVIYYEQRGCGRSEAAPDTNDYGIPALICDLDALRETLNQDQITLLGYSFGAELALRYAEQHPENVNKLILESPAEMSTSGMLIQIQGFYSIGDSTFRADIEKLLAKDLPIREKYFQIWNMASSSTVNKFLFVSQEAANKTRQLWQESQLPGNGHMVRVIFESSQGDLLKTVEDLKTPCLIISGIHDKNGGFNYGKDLNQIMPNSVLKLYRKSAHFPDMEEPDRFAADVKDFILNQ